MAVTGGKQKVRTRFRFDVRSPVTDPHEYTRKTIEQFLLYMQREYTDILEQKIEDLEARVTALEP